MATHEPSYDGLSMTNTKRAPNSDDYNETEKHLHSLYYSPDLFIGIYCEGAIYMYTVDTAL